MERIILLTVIVILGYAVALALDYRVTKKEKRRFGTLQKG